MAVANRIEFTKTRLAALPPPTVGRITYYDTKSPKLALRVTATSSRAFYVVKRTGRGMAWVKLGTFPEMSVEQARKATDAALGEIARGHDPSPAAKRRAARQKMTLSEAFTQYIELHAVPRGRTKRLDDARQIWERCIGTLPDLPPKKHGRKRTKHPAGVDWSARKLDSITAAEVRALHAEIGRTHKTLANRALELLRSAYNRAREFGYGGTNPAQGVKPFGEVKRDRFLQGAELEPFFRELAADTSDDFRHFVLLSLLTGARRSNVLAARWEQFDLDGAHWRIPDTKNDEPLVVPLVPEAVEVLRARTPQRSGWVFPADSASGHTESVQKRWRAFITRAGLENLRIHDLRRSLGSWQAMQGASLVLIGRSLGHRSPDATAIYARVALDPVRSSVGAATDAMLVAGGVKQPATVVQLPRAGTKS